MKKFIAALCGISLIISLPFTVLGGDDLSKGAILDTLLQTAPDYTSYIAAEDIVSGYNEGEFRGEKLATDVEMLVMISRAFPSMPTPQGNNLITLPQKADLSQTPEWARNNLEYLNSRGIISAETVFDDSVTQTELTTYLRRVWRYYGGDKKDDFFTAVNIDKLNKAMPVVDYFSGAFSDTAHANNAEVKNIVTEIIRWGPLNDKEEKIKAVYLSSLEMQRGNGSMEPLKPYLDKVEAARNREDLTEALIDCDKGLYTNGLISMSISIDGKNTDRYLPCVSLYENTFTYDDYVKDTYKGAFMDYANTLLTAAGKSEADAAAWSEKIYGFEKGISKHCLRSADASDVEMTYNLWTFGELCRIYDFIDLRKLALADGFDLKDDDVVLVPDIGLAYNLAAECRNDLALAKQLTYISLLAAYAPVLSPSCLKANEKFMGALYGAGSAFGYSTQDRAVLTVKSCLAPYVSELYDAVYLNVSDAAAVRAMTEDIIAAYKKKITENTWMSGPTKAAAIKKLDTLRIKIGYNAGKEDYLKNADVKEGKTLFENTLAIADAAHKWTISNKDKPVDRSIWAIESYEANACYMVTSNEIVLPAGILKAPFYSSAASYEENMGGIGLIIAHEISHAFDNGGAAYDEKGDYINWWSAEDYKRFSEKCTDIAAMYDGFETATDIYTNGRLTVGEAIADLGGMSCAVGLLKSRGNADMEKFYTAYAKVWESIEPRESLMLQSLTDPHPAGNVRVNVCLANTSDFAETYGLGEGDGMYIPADERVGLW